jgi:hypothetical protein
MLAFHGRVIVSSNNHVLNYERPKAFEQAQSSFSQLFAPKATSIGKRWSFEGKSTALETFEVQGGDINLILPARCSLSETVLNRYLKCSNSWLPQQIVNGFNYANKTLREKRGFGLAKGRWNLYNLIHAAIHEQRLLSRLVATKLPHC